MYTKYKFLLLPEVNVSQKIKNDLNTHLLIYRHTVNYFYIVNYF